jgi:hypothetical protein
MGGSRLFVVSSSIFVFACGGSSGGNVAGAGGSVVPSAGGSSAISSGGALGTNVAVGTGGVAAVGAPNGGSPVAMSSGGAAIASGGAAGSGASSSGGASAGIGGASASTGGTSAGTGGTSGAGGAVTPDPPGTVSIQTMPFQVVPGGEVLKCQNFDNPFGGKDTAVGRIVSDMTPGSHHLQLYNLTEGTSRGIEDCPGSDFHAMVHAASHPHAETLYPAGMAIKMKGASGLRLQLHYINSGSDPVEASATLKFSPVDMTTITKWAAEIYMSRVSLTVPPGKGQTVSTSCSIPPAYGQIGLIGAGSHMHSRGVHFVAQTSTGVSLIDDTSWNEPPSYAYDPAVMLNPGDSISWTCTYDNNTGMTFTFGDSAIKNEMCIFAGLYYSTNANDTQIACQAVSPNGGVAQLQAY